MKSFFKSTLALIIALLICLFPVGCEQDTGGTDTPDSVTTEAQTDAPKTFLPEYNYYVIRNESMTQDTKTIEAMSYIRKAFEDIFGKVPKMSDDWYRESDGLVPKEYEILIGYTNRPQSMELYATLGVNDYAYYVESENVIAICGGNPDATLEAVKKFCKDAFNYEKNSGGEKKELTVGMYSSYNLCYK